MFIKFTSLIIPTKERLNNLKRLVNSVGNYINEINEIIIIDSSSKKIHTEIINYFKNFKNIKVLKSNPSASKQRNIGIKNFNKKNKFLMFCDDDIVFKKNSLFNMNKFIEKNAHNIGYGFNLIQKEKYSFFEKIKKNKFFINNGFYNTKPGVVCENGWHTKLINAKKDHSTMWLSTQACIYKTEFVNNILFDENLGKYSYLEDLFFSFELSKKGSLFISHNSQYTHPNDIQRNDLNFGIKEVVNRYKFVKKNNLKLFKFYLTILFKLLFNLIKIFSFNLNFVPKFLGNMFGLIICIIK